MEQNSLEKVSTAMRGGAKTIQSNRSRRQMLIKNVANVCAICSHSFTPVGGIIYIIRWLKSRTVFQLLVYVRFLFHRCFSLSLSWGYVDLLYSPSNFLIVHWFWSAASLKLKQFNAPFSTFSNAACPANRNRTRPNVSLQLLFFPEFALPPPTLALLVSTGFIATLTIHVLLVCIRKRSYILYMTVNRTWTDQPRGKRINARKCIKKDSSK